MNNNEQKPVGELEQSCASEVCAYRGKGVCKFKIGEYCPMYTKKQTDENN